MVLSTRVSFFYIISFVLLGLVACSGPIGIAAKKSPHERYADNLRKADLHTTSMGSSWLTAATSSLATPSRVTLPFSEVGFFAAERPAAAGFSFAATRGEVLICSLVTRPAASGVFVELWKPGSPSPSLLLAADSTGTLRYEVENTGDHLLRIQPPLLVTTSYTLTIESGPSLAFPIQPQYSPKATSFWGADRDGGRRSHEGVDIFAKKGTPTIAIAEGTVTRVNENTLGGKVVFMRPAGADYSLYYAHLDSQWVSPGQRVKVGDVIGQVGNTGNARTTPAHLHFGIYASGGAIDPWPFINVNRKAPATINGDRELLQKLARLTDKKGLLVSPESTAATVSLPDNTPLRILGTTANYYRVQLPDDRIAFSKIASVTRKPLRQLTITSRQALFTSPSETAAIRKELNPGEKAAIIASQGSFLLAEVGGTEGWIRQ